MEDQKVINYSLHTLYKTSLAIACVTLFSFSLGMVQPSVTGHAANVPTEQMTQKSVHNISSNLSETNSTPTITQGNDLLHFSYTFTRDHDASTPIIHAGDQFKITFSDISGVDIKDFRYSPSTTQTPNPDLNGLFTFSKSGNTLTLTATKDLPSIQTVTLGLDGVTQSAANTNTVKADATFISQGKTVAEEHYYFKNSQSSSSNPVAQNTSIAIFGHYSGAGLSSTREKGSGYSDNWFANGPGNLYFWHSQPAMVAYAQLSLPYNDRPSEIKSWKIQSLDGHKLRPENARVQIAPNNGKPAFDMSEQYKYNLVQDADGKSLDFSSSDLPERNGDKASDPQPTINITFYVDTDQSEITGESDAVHLRTSCDTNKGNVGPYDYTLSYGRL